MDYFCLEFLITIFTAFVVYYLLGFVNSRFKRIIVPQWVVLLAASLLFYGFSNYYYLVFIGASSSVSYLASLCTSRTESKKGFNYAKLFTTLAIICNVGVLAVLKYFNFFVDTFTSVFHLSKFTYKFIIPLGISFYTFSLISYNVDCYKRVMSPEKNPLKFLLFVSYFPKVLQGPISSFDKMKENGLYESHSFAKNDYLNSFFRIAVGAIKKIAIANVVGYYVDDLFLHSTEIYGLYIAFAVILYSIQLYCDFSGFIDMSIGISGLFGIKLEENFDTPYLSSSVQEFWRRWHITLGAWLKKYIYIPLGGNRVPIWRWIINTFIVWLVSGLWHGANWTFVLWGLYYGLLLVMFGLGTQIRKRKGTCQEQTHQKPIVKFINVISTFLMVSFGWILFRSSNIIQAKDCVVNLHILWKVGDYNVFASFPYLENMFLLLSVIFIGLLIIIKVVQSNKEKILSRGIVPENCFWVSKYALTIGFAVSAIFIFLFFASKGTNGSSFIYFNF